MPNGYGTYISAALLLGATLAHQFGWIDDATFNTLMGLAGTGGMVFLRRANTNQTNQIAAGQAVIARANGVDEAKIQAVIAPPAKEGV